MIDARAVALALGGDVLSGSEVLAPGPGHSPKDRSLSIDFDPSAPDGFVVHSFAGDDWRACRDYVRSRLGMPPWKPGDGQDRCVHPSRIKEFDRRAVDREAERRPRSEEDLLQIKYAVAIWDRAADPQGTLAERYLNSRALELTAELAGPVLRFHPRCPWRNEDTGRTDYIPALIAAFRSIDDDVITAIHRIALNPDGTKLDRRMLGPVRRAAVKLDPSSTTGELAIGEGIETCMAARQLGIRPCWALGSTSNILGFPVIGNITQLTILGEPGEASRDAIRFCAPRWRNAGRRVRIIMPEIGSDLNDELIAGGLR
jgi:putative DNA primase/helicase